MNALDTLKLVGCIDKGAYIWRDGLEGARCAPEGQGFELAKMGWGFFSLSMDPHDDARAELLAITNTLGHMEFLSHATASHSDIDCFK